MIMNVYTRSSCRLLLYVFSWLTDFLLRDETCSLDVEQMKPDDLPRFAWMRKLMRMSGVQVNIQVNEDRMYGADCTGKKVSR